MRTPGYLSVVALLAASLSVGYAEAVSGPEAVSTPEVVPAAESEAAAEEEEEAAGGALATFEGRVIDLSQGWDGATACMYDPATMTMAECFSSEEEMDLQLAAADTSFDPRRSLRADPQAFASCSSYLRLYDGSWYSGAVLHLATRGYWHNLSWYGFNQRTSSYRIGGCSALFADWSNGGGGFYPTYLTQAWDRSGTMIYGWNNDVSSVFIY